MSNNIQDKAMIVRLFIGMWTARKYDKKVSDKTAQVYHASNDVGRYNKVLIAQDEVGKIIKVVSDARNWHYENTLPWQDSGERILPAANYLEYTKAMRKFREQYEAAVSNFTKIYPQLVEDSKSRLGAMYNELDYPHVSEIGHKFTFDVYVTPVPMAADFRVGLQKSEVAKIQKDIEERVNNAVADAMKDLWNRLKVMIDKMVTKLSDTDAVFRDSLIDNIIELTNIIPRLNVTNDPNLEKIRKEVEEKLCSVSPEELRDNKEIRGKVADTAQSILDAMNSYMGVK
jgi:paraquat-inducible protein B